MVLLSRTEPQIPTVVLPRTLQAFMPPACDSLGQLGPRNYEFFQQSASVPFSADEQAFSLASAWLFSDCAFLAYSNRSATSDVEEEIRPPLLRLFREPVELKVFLGSARCWNQDVPDDRIQGYVVHNRVWGVVAFRGTLPESMPNWLTDSDFVLEPALGPVSVQVHRGFKAALDCLWKQGEGGGLEDYLSGVLAQHPNLRLWFTGHSLGAALATLAIHRFRRAQGLYTFGSPKVGNQAFVDEMNDLPIPHYRVINRRDIVTTLPFFPPFEHCGTPKPIASPVRLKQVRRRLAAAIRAGETAKVGAELSALFDKGSKLQQEFLEQVDLLRACLDHFPVLYSKNLWNRLVRTIG